MRKHLSILIPALALTLGLVLAAPRPSLALEAGPRTPAFAGATDGVRPRVAVGEDGGFAILWLRGDGTLAVRGFSASGAPAGPEHTLFTPSTSGGRVLQTSYWDVAPLPGGGFVAVWDEVTSIVTSFSSVTRLRLLDATGAPASPARDLDNEGGFSPFSVTVDENRVLTRIVDVTWFFYANRFTLEGVSLGPTLEIVGDPEIDLESAVALLPDGGFAVARLHEEGVLPVTLRRLHPDGTPAGAEVVVHSAQPAVRTEVLVETNESGHVVVVWKEAVGGSPLARSVARVFGPGGEPVSPETVVAASVEGAKHYILDVEMRPDGSFLVQWTRGLDLLASSFAADGRQIGSDLVIERLTAPAAVEADAEVTPGGWISTWTLAIDGPVGSSGPWFSSLTTPCNDADEPGLCLNSSRFRATVTWHVPATGARGVGQPIPLTQDTGAFWFFQPANYELTVKVLDGRGINDHFWVFYGSLTDVEFDLTVTDTLTGQVRTYHNPAGTMASRADTTAFREGER